MTPFQSLSQDQKIDFFVKCQQLMLLHHPTSSFIIREDTVQQALDACYNNIQKYQGYCYADENVCVLWNHIVVSDPNDAKRAVQENAYRPPNPDFNAVSIDFAVFRDIKDCIQFVKNNNNNLIKYVLFIREGNPKIYPIESLLRGIRF